MNKIFRKTSSIKLPERADESHNEETGRAHKGVSECTECHNVHFRKRWYASLRDIGRSKIKELVVSRKEICPACKMIKNNSFEGELFTEGFPEKHKEELANLVHNFGKTATEIDPQHRIIKTEETPKGYRMLTTENLMVDRLAKKIKEVFHNVEIVLSYSQEPFKVDRAHVIYKEK